MNGNSNNDIPSPAQPGSNYIMIYGELDGTSSLTSSSLSSKKHRKVTALSLEVSDLAYFTELQPPLVQEDGMNKLNTTLPLVFCISRDRTNDENRNPSKKHLRRRRRNKYVTIGEQGETPENTRNGTDTQAQEGRLTRDSEADQAAGVALNKDGCQAAKSA